MEEKLWVCRETNEKDENDVIFGMDSSLHRDLMVEMHKFLKAQVFAINLTFDLGIIFTCYRIMENDGREEKK